ncbi:MAG: tetratricopeptide repeat protein [Pikeienuella sp.]
MTTLYETADSRIDLFLAGGRQPRARRPLVAVFDHLSEPPGGRILGKGFGTEAFLGEGCDVLAVRCSQNLWFQDLLAAGDLARSVAPALLGYRTRTGYGSSMGGYGALALAGPLGLDRVLAIAPQADLDLPGESRWRQQLATITARFGGFQPLKAHHLAGIKWATLLFDPVSEDAAQIAAIEAALPAIAYRPVKVRHCRHYPGVAFGREGLKRMVLELAHTGRVRAPRISRAAKRASPVWHFAFAEAIERTRGVGAPWSRKVAILALARAVALSPEKAAYRTSLGRLLRADGRLEEALIEIRRAAALVPRHDHARAESEVLAELGRLDLAIAAGERAVRLAGEGHPMHRFHKAHLDKLTAAACAAA